MPAFINDYDITHCTICPRKCGIDRTRFSGFCGGGDQIHAARSALHFWEEPCISGTNGSGTIFFSGCNLRCCFCQNAVISQEHFGTPLTQNQLADCILQLQADHAHNINFVTGTHYIPWIAAVLRTLKERHDLTIPVVWNSSGYESLEGLAMLDGLVDIYLPDFKYLSPETATLYAAAEDYPQVAEIALKEMLRQVGKPVSDENGILQKGMIVRHLILPSHRHESMALLERLAELLPAEDFLISIMGQYTPPEQTEHLPSKHLKRRLTTMEYQSVLKRAEALGLDGFSQDLSSARKEYTPNFTSLEGLPHEPATH